ncbi:hypothetical protein HDE78_004115 [Rhodanobacter sp. K2T2]|nr:hypothetical protein [Rhodanobacter sp. K2T2]
MSHRNRRRAEPTTLVDPARNIGAETDSDTGSAGTPQGNGNSVRSGDVDVPIDAGVTTDR